LRQALGEVGPVAGFGWAGAVQIAEAIRSRQVSAAEVLAEQLDRIARLDAELGSVVTLDAEGARGRAAEADKALARGEVWGPLHGVGITIEDIHATAAMRSAFGGYRPFADYVPEADATVVARLRAAGAIVVGKTNGPCLWGDDTLFIDPIRKFRVLTTAGPMARSIADLRLAMQVISGPDGRDPEVPPVPWRETGLAELAGLRVAYAPGYPPSVATEIRAGIDALAGELGKLGMIVEDRLPDPALAGQGPLVDELFAMLAFAAEARRPARRSRARVRCGTTWSRWTGGMSSWPAGPGSSPAATCSWPRRCRCAPGRRTTNPPTAARRRRPGRP
jgi:Asp-tRNA(Asn)/Glu-tRNA(Gln) amidotransferase A subunit family amidase